MVAETLNMSGLRGYAVGGTLHLIANNQVGFTTDPQDDRSTRYSSDLARGFDIPVVHVNADDPEACLAAARLAFAYRQKFRKDFVIDLVGYRRWGHNEARASFTQRRVRGDPRPPHVRELYAKRLGTRACSPPTRPRRAKAVADELAPRWRRPAPGRRARDEDTSRARGPRARSAADRRPRGAAARAERGAPPPPRGFPPTRGGENVLEKRREALASDRPATTGQAEALAFASLLAGVPVRLTGRTPSAAPSATATRC